MIRKKIRKKIIILTTVVFILVIILAMIVLVPALTPVKNIATRTMFASFGNTLTPDGRIQAIFSNSLGDIMVDIQVPEQPKTMPVYVGKYLNNGYIHSSKDHPELTQQTECPLKAAPELAKKALDPYGGLPPDAILEGRVVCTIDNFTGVRYKHSINGIPIIDDIISLDFDQNSDVFWLMKEWRIYEYQENVSIINVSSAVEKFKDEMVLNPLQCRCAGNFNNVQLKYFNGYRDRNVTTLEPVWVFYGTGDSGNGLAFIIAARESNSTLDWADFSANVTQGNAPLSVKFTEAARYHEGIDWIGSYNFGDGNNGWEKNLTHTYQKPGIYTVELYGLDDELGSLCIKRDFIIVY